MIKVIIGKR